jgi:Protein of unknown function (DUF3887)
MRRTLAAMAVLQLIGCAHGATVAEGSDPSALSASGRAFIEHLSRGEYPSAEAQFSEGMKRFMSVKNLEEFWVGIERESGSFQTIEDTALEQEPHGWSILVTCRFAHFPRTFYVGLDSENRVGALYSNAVLPVGRAYVRYLSRHDYDGAFALSSADMQRTASPKKLAKLWASLEAENGAFHQITSVKIEGDAMVAVAFADKSVTFSVCVDVLGKVCGFHAVNVAKRSGLDVEPQLDFERQDGP